MRTKKKKPRGVGVMSGLQAHFERGMTLPGVKAMKITSDGLFITTQGLDPEAAALVLDAIARLA